MREADHLLKIRKKLFVRIALAIRHLKENETISPMSVPSKIPQRLLPSFTGKLIVDVMMFKGEIYAGLIVSPTGDVVGVKRNAEFSPLRAVDIYAIRIRSGFLGQLGLTGWRYWIAANFRAVSLDHGMTSARKRANASFISYRCPDSSPLFSRRTAGLRLRAEPQ